MNYLELKNKAHALSLRERLILTVGICALIFVLWFQLFYNPLQADTEKNRNSLKAIDGEIAELSTRLVTMAEDGNVDPNVALEQEQAALQAQLDDLEKAIRQELGVLVPPEKMSEFLSTILEAFEGLKVVSAKNLPVERIRLEMQEGDTSANNIGNTQSEEEDSLLFAHNFEIVFEGSYFATLSFVQKLEEMEGLLWENLQYEVDTYPKARVKIVLRTLSLDPGWLGV